MFMDFREDWSPLPPRAPTPRPPRLSPRGERVLAGVIGVNLILLLLAPIGGATVIEAFLALWR